MFYLLQRQQDRDLRSAASLSKSPQQPGPGWAKARSPELCLGLPMEAEGAQVLETSPAASQPTLPESWNGEPSLPQAPMHHYGVQTS